jgi:hypothetical protein
VSNLFPILVSFLGPFQYILKHAWKIADLNSRTSTKSASVFVGYFFESNNYIKKMRMPKKIHWWLQFVTETFFDLVKNERTEQTLQLGVPLSSSEWGNDMAKFLADSLLSPHKQRPLSSKGMTQLQAVNVQTLRHQILELSAITCSGRTGRSCVSLAGTRNSYKPMGRRQQSIPSHKIRT